MIVQLAELEGWDLHDPCALAWCLWVRLGFDIPEEDLWGVFADAAIDAAYPQRGCSERIALDPVAREPMEASQQ